MKLDSAVRALADDVGTVTPFAASEDLAPCTGPNNAPRAASVPIRVERGRLVTGRDVRVGPGCRIRLVGGEVRIGARTRLGAGVLFGAADGGESPGAGADIVVGDDVRIGDDVVVRRGVRIGDGAVITAGSRVTADVPTRVVFAGGQADPKASATKTAPPATVLDQPVKLHLGCGPRYIPGFLHVDGNPAPHVDVLADLRHLSFLPDRSAALIYASHVLEHFGRHEFRKVLREWYRVLAVGGTLRLAVPDFAACARLYHEHGLQGGLSGLIGLICGGQRDDYDFHKMIFDEDLLRSELLAIGFRRVRRWDWKETEHADIDDYSQAYLPHMDKTNGTLVSLNLEAAR
jgi:predicted SAM-dependent methyltransferase/acetyltransferase-like isoleucine patch superfamily enzyme